LNMTKPKQLYCSLSTKFQIYQTYSNRQLQNSCNPFVMVDYLITLIAALLRLNQTTNIKQDLMLCENNIYSERKRPWVSFL